MSLFDEIRHLARLGFGVDDICVMLNCRDRKAVRRIVLGEPKAPEIEIKKEGGKQ